ncbi:uncharacterized protein BCR38DRAFT_460881 [Pseudomassariella vexata]|uniref:Uncharacterized protein n=1 Tax=Pseudomassariella vexata TaxID=1141098 RepID=A0A1Y2DHI9_9PEZI|nr:uncharacterized protein BCR38DRAFT_460881 [Pseudomassariella vexata]ORY58574.1 hypothetical protein BCR38DRAFT_460881 [Pseudomassariella vexata]
MILAAAVSAKGDNNGDSVKSQCKSYARLTKATELAANATKLADKFDNNQTEIDAFKAKVADKQTELATLASNSTLMSSCAVVQAVEDDKDACDDMEDMEKMIEKASNPTKLADKFDNNATKIAEFKAKASDAVTKLADMQGNTTLLAFCSVQNDISSCKKMAKLEKTIAKAGNTTYLNSKFDGNATKIAEFQDKAAKAQIKLDALMANSSLMDTCRRLAQAGTSASDNSSLAGHIEIVGGLVTMLAVATAMFML